MKRLVCLASFLALAASAFAAEPYTLDRSGVFWKVEASTSGVVLVGVKNGEEVVRSLVSFPLGIAGQNDSNLQLVADELTGKVVLAWQRNWSEAYSDVVLAVWNQGQWERVSYLGGNASLRPRNPVLKLAQATSTYPDPEDPEKTVTVSESFALLTWWQGDGDQQGARLAILRLAASPDEDDALSVREVVSSPGIGFNCPQPLSSEAVERPTFAAEPPGPVSHLLVASPSTCLLFVHEIRLELDNPQTEEGGLGVVAMRRRHTPIFGVRRVLPVPQGVAAEGTRVVLGPDAQPVLYRVLPDRVSYTVATPQGWSEARTLQVGPQLPLDKAIALVENLAR
ncbi:MAG: hypothetical protein ACP5NF_03505 [Thermoanaerobaculum sp.]